ncbi:MAG TPA: hypothetical protein VFA52_02470 [Candidatus Paceibacterota bacterium]|nr:hypothetical protein [Candidatus Paceibacterota bacterium]
MKKDDSIVFTPNQLGKIIRILDDKGVNHKKLQSVLESGHFADFAEAIATSDFGKIKRDDFRRLILPHFKANFKVWKSIVIGTPLRTADDFRRDLKNDGYRINGWGNNVLDQKDFTVAKKMHNIDLVVVSVADLYFKEGAIQRDIYARAKEIGLGLCPAEVGPQLRLQYKDQPRGECLWIGMEYIRDSDGYPLVFDVAHNDVGQWLCGHLGEPGHFWAADDLFVFVARK